VTLAIFGDNLLDEKYPTQLQVGQTGVGRIGRARDLRRPGALPVRGAMIPVIASVQRKLGIEQVFAARGLAREIECRLGVQ